MKKQESPGFSRGEQVKQAQTRARVWAIRLPYVKPPLSLNARQHWAARARETRMVRSDVRLLVRAARVPAVSRVRVQLEYIHAAGRQAAGHGQPGRHVEGGV